MPKLPRDELLKEQLAFVIGHLMAMAGDLDEDGLELLGKFFDVHETEVMWKAQVVAKQLAER